MSTPQPITLEAEDGTTYTIFVSSEPDGPSYGSPYPDPPRDGLAYGDDSKREVYGYSIPKDPKREVTPQPPLHAKFVDIHKTLQGYAEYMIGAFRHFSQAEVEEMNLRFGICLNGKTGLPVLAQGEVTGDFQIEIKCKFPKSASIRSPNQ